MSRTRSRSSSQSRTRPRHRSGRYGSRSTSRSPNRREDTARNTRQQDDSRPSLHQNHHSSNHRRRSARSRSRRKGSVGNGKERQRSRSLSSSPPVFGPERPEQHRTSDRIAEGHANSNLHSKVTPVDEEPLALSNVEPTACPKSSDAPNVVMRDIRPPRNRGLLESVQAHLSSNSRARSNIQKRNAEPVGPVSITASIGAHGAAYAEEDGGQSPTLVTLPSNDTELRSAIFDASVPAINIAHPKNGASDSAPARR